MKKAIIPIIAALFVISIILVSFLGTIPSGGEETIYCDYIVSHLTTFVDPTSSTNIYTVDKRPDVVTPEDEDWYKNDYGYIIRVFGIRYVYERLGRTIALDCEAKTKKEGKKVTNPSLSYFWSEKKEDFDYLDINSEGAVIFTSTIQSLKTPHAFTFISTSNDGSNVSLKLRMIVARYTF